jgi:hypothetical protein
MKVDQQQQLLNKLDLANPVSKSSFLKLEQPDPASGMQDQGSPGLSLAGMPGPSTDPLLDEHDLDTGELLSFLCSADLN